MSKKQEIGGTSKEGRMVEISSNHVLWTAKNINGTLAVEKFAPGIKSKHNLYIECVSEGCQNNRITKVFIPFDVEYFMNEKHKISEVLSKCNTFTHLATKRQICEEFAELIVQTEDPEAFDKLSKLSNLAREALRYMTERASAKKNDSKTVAKSNPDTELS